MGMGAAAFVGTFPVYRFMATEVLALQQPECHASGVMTRPASGRFRFLVHR